MTTINVRVSEPGGGPGVQLALACGALGGVRQRPSRMRFNEKARAYSAKVELPAGVGGADVSVYRLVGSVWVLRGQLRVHVDGLGAKPRACALVQISGTPGAAAREEAPPRAELWLASGAETRDKMLLAFQRLAHGVMREALPATSLPPLLAFTVAGVVPFWATFLARAAAAPTLAGDLLRLACLMDADAAAVADLADAGPVTQARVLARALTLLSTTIEYTPDVALARGADVGGAGATPDGAPRRPRGTMPTNTFDDAATTWADDCEGQTALAAAVWRAMAAADETRDLAARFRFVVLVITVRGANANAFHVCGALLPRGRGAAALLECVVRTRGIPEDASVYDPPKDAAKRAERPLVRLPDGSLNNWYDQIVFAVDLAAPTELLLPYVAGRGGGSVAQLLAGDVALEPLAVPLNEALEQRIVRERDDMPATDLRGVRVQLGEARIDARRPMVHQPDAPAPHESAIHVPDVLRNPQGSWFVF